MSSGLYDSGRQRFLSGSISWGTDTFKVVLIHTASYAVNLATDEFYSSVAYAARVGIGTALTAKTTYAGVADADDVTFTALTGSSVEAALIYKDSGVEATSPLIAYIDTLTGIPYTPTGLNLIVTWSSGSSKIFKL